MIAKQVRDLNRQLLHFPSISIEQILQKNAFEKKDIVVCWLVGLVKAHLQEGKKYSWEDSLSNTPGVEEALRDGDAFYKGFLEKNGLSGGEEDGQEWNDSPYSSAVKSLYLKFFVEASDTSLSQPSFVYEEISHLLERNLWTALGANTEFHQYESWLLLYRFYGSESIPFEAYLNALPPGVIEAEIPKMSAARQGMPLDIMANLHGSSRDNKQLADNYVERLMRIPAQPAWDFVKEATRSWDMVWLNEEISLQDDLLKRVSLDCWMKFVDEIEYPLIQFYLLCFVNDLEDYIGLVKLVLQQPYSYKTKQERFLMLIMMGMFEFMESALGGLKGIMRAKETHYHTAAIEDIIKEAEGLYQQWTTVSIVQAFQSVFNLIFGDKKLSESPFLISLFDWVNSESKSQFDKVRLDYRVTLIDLLNDVFNERLQRYKEDRDFLLEHLKPYQYHWLALERLVEMAEKNRLDETYTARLLGKFIEHIRSEQFRWSTPDGVDFQTVVNQAYCFSLLLAYSGAGFKSWSAIYSEFKYLHDGWQEYTMNTTDNIREAFLLTAGAGLSYYYYYKKQPEMGSQILFHVLEVVSCQFRAMVKHTSIDYETPLSFLTNIIARYDPAKSEEFIQFVADRFDDLKILLSTVGNLYTINSTVVLSDKLKAAIEARIATEFWVIERSMAGKKKEKELKGFVELKENCLRNLVA